jgi:hypothetical protein
MRRRHTDARAPVDGNTLKFFFEFEKWGNDQSVCARRVPWLLLGGWQAWSVGMPL